jgi:DNA-binding NarL/FixJ family response regulator
MSRILIADDSDETRAFLRTTLSGRGWTICGEAANGRQAVLLASQLRPDLVVLDLSMPMLSGLEAAREIRKAAPSLPIILFTLHKVPQLDLDAAAIGVRKVVSKDDGLPALVSAVEEVLGTSSRPIGPLHLPADADVKVLPLPAVEEALGPLAAPATDSIAQQPLGESPNSSGAEGPPASAASPAPPSTDVPRKTGN